MSLVQLSSRGGRTPLADRRVVEASVLSLLAIAAVWRLRSHHETGGFWLEIIGVLALTTIAVILPLNSRWRAGVLVVLGFLPILSAYVIRSFGSASAFEMTALTTLGVVSLILAVQARTNRLRAMSVVTSGFLLLFTTFISEESRFVLFAIGWLAICVWHLVANHWERLDACMPESIRRTAGARPASVLLAVAIFIGAGLIARDRFSDSRRLNWGFMPTSGGNQYADAGATSGVGDGDASVAAKDDAQSFGPVESDLFLESTQSTLFDMFSDSIGEPKRKNKSEKRQGMMSDKVIEARLKTSKSERSAASFTTDRKAPKASKALDTVEENAIIQWIGPTGIRLAMHRFDTFDGIEWTQSANFGVDRLSQSQRPSGDWFVLPTTLRTTETAKTTIGKVRVLRLDTTRIPTPMLTQGVHIKDVNRLDFFAVDQDGCWNMPGRERIPPLTVIQVASASVLEDELLRPNTFSAQTRAIVPNRSDAPVENGAIVPDHSDPDSDEPSSPTSGRKLAAELARQWSEGISSPFVALKQIESNLRNQFTFDRTFTTSSDDPLFEFLSNRRGGDHLFATAFAEMAASLGYQSRLVTGFYVRSSALSVAAGYANVTVGDTHVWAEVLTQHDRWIEFEPSPGFELPTYAPSLWLRSQRWAAAYWVHLLASFAGLLLVYVFRCAIAEVALRCIWMFTSLLGHRLRLRIACWVIECRAKLVGSSRPPGTPQRDWLLGISRASEEIHRTALGFCNAADALTFGSRSESTARDLNRSAQQLVKRLTPRFIRDQAQGRQGLSAT